MNVIPTKLRGVVEIALEVRDDARGNLVETWARDRYRAAGIEADFVQDNRAVSVAGALRGLHYQRRHPQGKLVSVTRGEIFDVVVDLRAGSPTFGQWASTVLTVRNQLWIPPGFAHGFLARTEADVTYKLTATYVAGDDRAIRWNDPQPAIAWPTREPILSERDARAPWLSDAELP